MRLLLDTQIFLWFLRDSRRLRTAARHQIREANEVFVSSASIWEATIKTGLGKLDVKPDDLVAGIAGSGFVELPVLARHAALVASLPPHHRDPFDRLLIAQAMYEPLRLLTEDTQVKLYSAVVQLA